MLLSYSAITTTTDMDMLEVFLFIEVATSKLRTLKFDNLFVIFLCNGFVAVTEFLTDSEFIIINNTVSLSSVSLSS